VADTKLELSENYIKERDRLREELDLTYQNAESLPFGIRGIVKAGISVAKATIVPILATFAGINSDFKQQTALLNDEPIVKRRTKEESRWWEDILRTFGYKDSTIKAVNALIPDQLPGPNILMFVYVAVLMLKSSGNLMDVISADTYKSLMAKYRPSTPRPEEVLRASFVAPELHDKVVELLRENGLTDEAIKLLFVSNYQLEDLQTIREVFHREGKSEDWIDERLGEHGFTPERIGEIKTILPVIPGIQDLVFFMAREAFEPDMIARYGLDELYPGELTQWAAKHGLNEFWARKYWLAHWNHPELRTVFELFHRDQLSTDEMWNYFGLVEIPPFWREKLINISYNVITRVDARRMWQLGVITDETQLFDLYRHMGYSPEDAQLMTEWTKTYSSAQERDLTRTDIVQAYIDRDLSAIEASDFLKRIGYPGEQSNFIVYRTEMEMQRSEREEKLGLVKDQFTSNLINQTEARNTLVGLGFRVERVNELLGKWEFLRWKNTKLPSKTDLDKLYRSAIISRDEYIDTMRRLGYTEKHIGWYLEYIDQGKET